MSRISKMASRCPALTLDHRIRVFQSLFWLGIVLATCWCTTHLRGSQIRFQAQQSSGVSSLCNDSIGQTLVSPNGQATFGDSLQVLTYGTEKKFAEQADRKALRSIETSIGSGMEQTLHQRLLDPSFNSDLLRDFGRDTPFRPSVRQTCPGPHCTTNGGPTNSQVLVSPAIQINESERPIGPIRRLLQRRRIVRVSVRL